MNALMHAAPYSNHEISGSSASSITTKPLSATYHMTLFARFHGLSISLPSFAGPHDRQDLPAHVAQRLEFRLAAGVR